MKGFFNVLSDIRTSPAGLVHQMMQEHPATQEFFLEVAILYIGSMARQRIYADDVGHIVQWSRRVLDALGHEWLKDDYLIGQDWSDG